MIAFVYVMLMAAAFGAVGVVAIVVDQYLYDRRLRQLEGPTLPEARLLTDDESVELPEVWDRVSRTWIRWDDE